MQCLKNGKLHTSASADAELGSAHEVGPLVELGGCIGARKGCAVYETTDGVSVSLKQ